jgi:hypothetical protein
MSEDAPRTGAARDVPPPRPVASPPAEPPDDSGFARAARAVAEAVGGLVGGRADGSGAAAGRTWPGGGVRDVVGAVASAVGGAFGSGRGADPTSTPGDDAAAGERSPTAMLGDLLAAAAPRLPIRSRDRLRQAYPGASDAEIADALVARAARLTSGIGAATGGLSATHWFLPTSLLTLPLELGAETVLLAGIEVALIGELHELYGRPAPGDAGARASAYLASWSAQRSVDAAGPAGLGALIGVAGMQALRRRVNRKVAGAIPSAAPFLLGGALAARGNRRATEVLAERVLTDLRRGVGPAEHG